MTATLARLDRLKGVHPALDERVKKLLMGMEVVGFPMMITDGVRTLEQQQALYALGRTKPGKIVTYADGVKNRSNHQPKADGFGRAVDCCFLVDLDHDGQIDDPTWDLKRPWTLYGEMAIALGLEWGGKWTSITDRPHIEWKGL